MGTHPIFESDFDCLTEGFVKLPKFREMVYEQFVQIGGIVFLPASKKPAVIVNVIDLNRLLVDDGNCNRKTVNLKNIKLTDLSIKINHGARPGTVKKAWAAADIDVKWAATDISTGLVRQAKRAAMRDFDRYKLMRLKQERSRIVKRELGKFCKAK